MEVTGLESIDDFTKMRIIKALEENISKHNLWDFCLLLRSLREESLFSSCERFGVQSTFRTHAVATSVTSLGAHNLLHSSWMSLSHDIDGYKKGGCAKSDQRKQSRRILHPVHQAQREKNVRLRWNTREPLSVPIKHDFNAFLFGTGGVTRKKRYPRYSITLPTTPGFRSQ